MRPTMKKNTGYTLIEILTTMAILSILSCVAYVSYQGYTLSVHKKDLKTHAEIFARAVQNCISVNGKWSVRGLTQQGVPGADITPCDTNVGDNIEQENKKLKSILDFTCPAKAKCHTHTQNNNTCLYIQKEVSGKKLLVISRVNYNTRNVQIWCGEDSSTDPLPPGGRTCKDTPYIGNGKRLTDLDIGFKKNDDCWKK